MYELINTVTGRVDFVFDSRGDFDLQPTRLVTARGVHHGISTATHRVFEVPGMTPAAQREAAKTLRAARVAAIKVTTTAGNTFDGDEVSQGRMARAIVALQGSGEPSVTWVLADNTTIEATAAELTEALVLAGAAQAAVWVLPS